MKLTEQDKKRLAVSFIKEAAMDMFISSDATLEDITDAINIEYYRNFSVGTVHSWCIEGDWDGKRQKRKSEDKKAPATLGLKNLKEELDQRDYDRVTELIEALEDRYMASPNGKDLTALITGYKFKRDLRNSTIVDEKHNEISMILAIFNKTSASSPPQIQGYVDAEVTSGG